MFEHAGKTIYGNNAFAVVGFPKLVDCVNCSKHIVVEDTTVTEHHESGTKWSAGFSLQLTSRVRMTLPAVCYAFRVACTPKPLYLAREFRADQVLLP